MASFKRLKANAAEGGKPYREETVEYKDVVDGLNIVVRIMDDEVNARAKPGLVAGMLLNCFWPRTSPERVNERLVQADRWTRTEI